METDVIKENKDKSHREEYRIRYIPNAIKQNDGSFKHGFMVQGRTINHPHFGDSVWENGSPHETLDLAKSHVNNMIKNDKNGRSHYMSHNEGGFHDGNLRGLGEEYNNNKHLQGLGEENNKHLINFAMARNAVDFTDAVNGILSHKATEAMTGMCSGVASELFKNGYTPKSGDEKSFVDKHHVSVIDYPVKNDNGLPFRDDSAPHKSAKENNLASYNRGEDASVSG